MQFPVIEFKQRIVMDRCFNHRFTLSAAGLGLRPVGRHVIGDNHDFLQTHLTCERFYRFDMAEVNGVERPTVICQQRLSHE